MIVRITQFFFSPITIQFSLSTCVLVCELKTQFFWSFLSHIKKKIEIKEIIKQGVSWTRLKIEWQASIPFPKNMNLDDYMQLWVAFAGAFEPFDGGSMYTDSGSRSKLSLPLCRLQIPTVTDLPLISLRPSHFKRKKKFVTFVWLLYHFVSTSETVTRGDIKGPLWAYSYSLQSFEQKKGGGSVADGEDNGGFGIWWSHGVA